jgi:MFS family permease
MRILLVFSLGYFISCLFRGVNLAVAPDLAAALHLSPSDLGLLTSLYFVGLAGCQLPLGMLLDRFGPRRVESWLLLCAALGALLFGFAESKAMLMVSRLLIGIGVSACLMAALKAMALWFAPERLPSLNGAVFAIGGLGSVAAATPVALALCVTDWRGIFLGLALLTTAVAVLIRLGTPERNSEQPDSGLRAQLEGLRGIVASRVFWRVAPLHMVSQGVFVAVQGLWAGPYLRDVAGADAFAVTNAVSLLSLAMVAGCWLWGLAARGLARRGITPLTTAGVGMLAFMAVQLVILVGPTVPAAVTWPLYGLLGGSGVLCYAVLAAAFPAHMAGRVSTALTLNLFLCAFIVQSGIGWLLGWWPQTGTGYTPEAHRAAWLVMLAAQLAAFIWYCLPPRPVGRARHRPFATRAPTSSARLDAYAQGSPSSWS